MAVEDPEQLDVTCDRCGDSMPMDTTEYAGQGVSTSFGVDESTVKDNDWFIIDGEIVCPECISEEDEE